MEKKKSNLKSTCCKSEVRYSNPAPDFIGDSSPQNLSKPHIGTCYAICTLCGQPCNIYFPVRKVWTRNPKTQIIGDKRDKVRQKETDKEIQEIGHA